MKFKTFFSALALTAAIALPAAAKADSSIPRPEYPRPQFERTDWVNLNGEWTFSIDNVASGYEKGFSKSAGFDEKILVPFSPESKLSGVGHTDFIEGVWYHRNITVPAEWDGRNIRLNFGAVYYKSEVYIDGKLVGRHFGGTSSFSFDITPFVKAGQTHSLVVYATSDLRSGKQPAGKQSLKLNSMTCNYTRTTGIWQTVWMEPVSDGGLKQVQVDTDIDQGQIVVKPLFFHEGKSTLRVTVTDPTAPKKPVAQKTAVAANNSVVVLPMKKFRTWSPEDPFLYDVKYQVVDEAGTVIDEVRSYLGMRKVHLEGNKIYLNNSPRYQRLVLDQGYYPDSQWTAPSDEALRHDIELSMKAGFNGARLHQKVFEERFHYWADKLGYLTWGESSSWGMDTNQPETARNFITEWGEIIVRDRNHPSIIVWTPTNEEWSPDNIQFPRFMEDVYALTKQLDPTRPVSGASGGVIVKTDIWTGHGYAQDPETFRKDVWNDGKLFTYKSRNHEKTGGLYSKNYGFSHDAIAGTYDFPEYDGKMPYVFDEYGGIKWTNEEDMKQAANNHGVSWGYGNSPRSLEEFYTRLEALTDVLLSLSDYICGYCYTQLTDVEQEQNGLYYYDRSEKFDMERIHAVFSKVPEDYK